jgi:TRAP-type mannitol/chloroaromatic compound transport system substrate-binding protein
MARQPLTRRHLIAGSAAAVATAGFAAPAIAKGKHEWNMALTWPKLLPGLGQGATRLAERITTLSDGELTVNVYGAGELVPAFEVFDAIADGSIQMGHSASYYWLSKNRSAAFFCAVPGGLTAQEQNGWLYFDEGLKLWHEMYAEFNLIAFPAGNTGTQMGGWFKKELHDLSDLKGLKMRIPGIGGEIFGRLGGVPETIPGAELFTYLQSGRIDALEWVGPWNDMALGFHKIAKYYYGPGFHEGGPTLECVINRKAFLALPKHLQTIIKVACAAENQLMLAEYQANNIRAYGELQKDKSIIIQPYPEPILKAFFELAEEVSASTANLGDINRRIYESWSRYRKRCIAMGPVTEQGFMRGRQLATS